MEYEDKYEKYDEYMGDEETSEGEGYSGNEEEDRCHKRMVEVEEVLGIGSAETIAEICVNLCPPAFEVLDNLVEKKVIFDALVAGKGKVFVNGRVIKDIPYKTRTEVRYPSCTRISKATYGNIRHVTVEVPFALCIDIPESEKGAKVVVLESEVNSVEIPSHLSCAPNSCVSMCENPITRFDPCTRRLFHSITEKDCIFVKVKVVKPTIITLPRKSHEKY